MIIRIHGKIIEFRCTRCGCRFGAAEQECSRCEPSGSTLTYSANCPDCGAHCNSGAQSGEMGTGPRKLTEVT